MNITVSALQESADAITPIPLSTKLEQWRYVDFKNIESALEPASASSRSDIPDWLASIQHAVIFDNGQICAEELGQAWSSVESPTQHEHFQTLISSQCPHQLACVNSSSNAYQLQITGMADAPLLILFRSSGGAYGMNLSIQAQAGSAADIILLHDHQDHSEINYALHLDAGADAAIRIDEISLNANSSRVYHHKLIDAAKNAQITWTQMSYASDIDRHYWHGCLHDQQAFCAIKSACIANGQRQAHHVAKMDHLSPNTNSEQLFKSIAMDEARYSFNGLVHMAKGADESASNQQNSNLQLSPKARIHSRPQLDIHTDDVIAAHGSATGPTDPNELYYLRTRGLNSEQAERIIVRGFLQEVTHDFHHSACRDWAAEHIIDSLKD